MSDEVNVDEFSGRCLRTAPPLPRRLPTSRYASSEVLLSVRPLSNGASAAEALAWTPLASQTSVDVVPPREYHKLLAGLTVTSFGGIAISFAGS